MTSPGAAQAQLRRAARLHERAVATNAAGKPARGAQLVGRALVVLGVGPEQVLAGPQAAQVDPATTRLVTRLLITLAKSEVERNGPESGLRVLDAADAWVDRNVAAPDRVKLQNQRGLVLFRGGRFREALDQFTVAERWFESAPAIDVCRILLNRGAVLTELGRVDRARRDLARCVQLAGANSILVEQRAAVHNLGYVEFIVGNLPQALRLMDQGMQLDSQTQPEIALLDRARVLLAAGLYHDADETLAAAGEVARKERLWQDVGEVELARAECALLDGEFPAARRLAESARGRFRRRGNDRWRRIAELIVLQSDLGAGRPGLRLAQHASRLADEFTAQRFATQARTARLIAAESYLRAGRQQLAADAAAAADRTRSSDPISARLHSRLVHTHLALASDDRVDARREIKSGLNELSSYQSRFGSIDLQTASAVYGRQLTALSLSLALRDGRPATVLAAIEQGRAMSQRLPSVSAPEDPVTANLLAELRQLIEGHRALESDQGSVGQVESHRHRVAALQHELRSRSWQSEGVGNASKPARFTDIGAELSRTDSVLVSFLEVDATLHAVVVGAHKPVVAQIGPAEPTSELIRRTRAALDVLANGHLPSELLAAVKASAARTLDALDVALVRSLAQVGDGRVVIVPTGALAVLPWGLLPSLRGRPVVVAPSATAWLSARSQPGSAVTSIAAFAGPDLIRAGDEIKAVGEAWPDATLYTEQTARHAQLTEALRTASIVHVAAHGEHQADNPLFSSIRLVDAPLFAYELDRAARASEHVILSACSLGQATIRPGGETLGLTSVLLNLGARSVISGVARVNDDVAADVMMRYHAMLARGVDSARALADACAAETHLPAPFVCFGSAWSGKVAS